MIDAAARELRDGEIVLVGVGTPNTVANRALATHAPGLQLVYESGTIGSIPPTAPLSIGDPTLVSGAIGIASVDSTFEFLIQGGRIDVGFVGAAQIDRLGRLNSTALGDYRSPTHRLPGSGGACEIVWNAARVVVLAPLERRRFPAEVDFTTSAPRSDTELTVVTDKLILRRPPGESELRVTEIFEGVEVDDVAGEFGWPVRFAPDLEGTRDR
jgi:glutaconate CoA-transferase subunit B